MNSPQVPTRISVETLRLLAADAFELEPEDLTEGASFYEELGVDSIQRMEFVVRLERRLGVKFNDDEAGGLDDLNHTFALLKSRGIVVEP